MEKYIREVIYKDDSKRYEELASLSEKISKIKLHKKPFVVEFLGSSRSGKTTTINMIADVLTKHGLHVKVVDEEEISLTKDINRSPDKKMNIDSLEYTKELIKEKIKLHDKYIKSDFDIVLFDRGINDEFIWLNTFDADAKIIKNYDEQLKDRTVDYLIVLTCDIETSLKRKYLNSLSIKPTKWTNYDTLSVYLSSLNSVSKYFINHSKDLFEYDTSSDDKVKVGIKICNQLLDNIM